jgi:hypothetical protein
MLAASTASGAREMINGSISSDLGRQGERGAEGGREM